MVPTTDNFKPRAYPSIAIPSFNYSKTSDDIKNFATDDSLSKPKFDFLAVRIFRQHTYVYVFFRLINPTYFIGTMTCHNDVANMSHFNTEYACQNFTSGTWQVSTTVPGVPE